MPITRPRLDDLTELLERLAGDRSPLDLLTDEERIRLTTAAGALYQPDPAERRRRVKLAQRRERAERTQRHQEQLAETGIRALRAKRVFTTPNVFPPLALGPSEPRIDANYRESVEPQHCYICKRDFFILHEFYDQLCPDCAEFNLFKRSETTDLTGRVALLTGGRVKIGYQAGIKLLRAGVRLIVTTRFPRDAALRYAAEQDFDDWKDRLDIYGLDLRHTPSVELFCEYLVENTDRLDFIVNNACQTVRRPPGFYQHMMALETAVQTTMHTAARALVSNHEGLRGYELLSADADASSADQPAVRRAIGPGLAKSAELSQIALLPGDEWQSGDLFPIGVLDQDLQQTDLRDRNSWRLTLAEVSSVELLETQLVNAVAPFVLNARLKALMLRSPERDKHIVNVSAVEGQFYRRMKTTRHPHTNMAKAALNMMTRTSAADYFADGIHMNSVDTGWVSDEDAIHIATRKTAEQHFHPPLDIVDGAARIVDPIIAGHASGEHVWGQFLKDYRPTDW